MTPKVDRPSWVIEQLLNWRLFDCCGNEKPFPFQCDKCSRPLVFCYECDGLYTDLHDLKKQTAAHTTKICPGCSAVLGDDLMISARYRISFDRWRDAGLDYLLVERSIPELAEEMVATAEQIEEMLWQGMAHFVRGRLFDYRNLADSIAVHFPDASPQRDEGIRRTGSSTLDELGSWLHQMSNPMRRAYAILGISEAAVEELLQFELEQPDG